MPENLTLDFGLSSVTASPPAAPSSPAAPTTPSAPLVAAPASPSQAASPRPGEPPAAVAPAPDRIKVGDRTWTAQELNDVASFKAAEDSRRATLPSDPTGYKAELPQDFKPPEGVTFSFNENDPILAQARTLAHAKGWSQADLSDALALYASVQVADMTKLQNARQAEINKLGAAGGSRVDHVIAWLKARGGPDAEVLCKTLDYAPVAGTVMAFERLMQQFSSQGGSGFSQQHRSNPDPTKIPGFENMSFEQRRQAQDQRNRR
jgi:hypothetical protein